MWVIIKSSGPTAKLNTDFVALLYPDNNELVLSSGNHIVLSGDDYCEVERSMFPTRKRVAKDDTEMADFLNELHRLTGGKNAAILTPQRKKKLTEILKTMSKDQLTTAAYYIGKDSFLQGENENHKRYGDIDYILRPDKAARWAEYKPEDKRKKMF